MKLDRRTHEESVDHPSRTREAYQGVKGEGARSWAQAWIGLLTASVLMMATLSLGTATASATTWNLPASDLSAALRSALKPQVAVAPDGATTVVWERFNGTNNIVQAATRPAGSSLFGQPEDLSVAGKNARNPQVAVAPDGATTVVWEHFTGADWIIQATTRPAGSSIFGSPQDLSAGGGDAGDPQVAVAPDGATTVVWEYLDEEVRVIQAATRPAGSSVFVAPQDLSTSGGGRFADLAVAPDGTTTVVWKSFDGANDIIQAATRAAGSSVFGSPEDLSAAGENASDPRVAVAPDGATTAVWQRSNGANTTIQAATQPSSSSGFGSPEDLSAGGENAVNSRVAVAPDGATTVVWQRYNGTNLIIQAATRAVGESGFGVPEDLSAAGGNASGPQVAVAADGTTIAVWYRFNGANDIIQASTRAAGSSVFGVPEDLSAAGRSASVPQVAFAADGAATVVWQRFDGSNSIIQSVTSDPITLELSAIRSGGGTGTVTSSPAGIDCGSVCQAQFNLGSTVTLTAKGSSDSTFVGWSGPCTGTGSCQVTMDEARLVTAEFARSPKVSFVSIKYPKNQKKGKKKVWEVTVKNSGGLKLTGVEVRFNHPNKGSKRVKGTKTVGALDPGKSKTVKFGVTIRKKTKAKVVITAASSNGGKKEKKKTVRVK